MVTEDFAEDNGGNSSIFDILTGLFFRYYLVALTARHAWAKLLSRENGSAQALGDLPREESGCGSERLVQGCLSLRRCIAGGHLRPNSMRTVFQVRALEISHVVRTFSGLALVCLPCRPR